MRIDRVKLIAEMARQNIRIKDLAEKALVSRVTITAMRSGKINSARRVAQALGVPLETLLEESGKEV